MREKIISKMKLLVKIALFAVMSISVLTGCSSGTPVDVLTDDSLKVSFSGLDGAGSMYASFNFEKVSMDSGSIYSSLEMLDFFSSIKIEYDDSATLSNGDTVTITASYDEDEAKDLGLNIKSTSYTVTVADLTEGYLSADEVPSDIVIQIKDDVEEYMAEQYVDNSWYSYEYSYDSMYYGYRDEETMALVVYYLQTTYHNILSGEDEISTAYRYCCVSPVDSSYLENGYEDIEHHTLDYDIESSEQVPDTVVENFSSYTITQFAE